MLSGSAALVVVPATALSTGTLVPPSLATGRGGAAAWFPVELAEAEPDATMVTPGPAGAAAVPWRRPAVVRVAVLTLTVELEDDVTA